MTETRELAPIPPDSGLTKTEGWEPPDEVVARASAQAKALMDIVEKQGLFQTIGKKKYLMVEAWTTIGRFNRATPVVEYCHPVERDGHIVGYEAKVNVVRDGRAEVSAISLCGLDEYVCRGRQGIAAENACMSMAQTRATSKALRLGYSYVAVLAGFEPTPAEEILGAHDDKTPETEPKAELAPRGFCPVHKKALQHRVGTGAKGAYDFWACPEREQDGSYCQEKPQVKGEHIPTAPAPAPEPQGPATGATGPAEAVPAGPPKADVDIWTAFWPAVTKLGYTSLTAAKELGAASVQVWLDANKKRTLTDALAILKKAKGA